MHLGESKGYRVLCLSTSFIMEKKRYIISALQLICMEENIRLVKLSVSTKIRNYLGPDPKAMGVFSLASEDLGPSPK